MGPPSDAELVARCRAGDADAWRELVERFSRYVYAIALQAFRLPEHDADDVFQDVFTRIYERLDQLRDDEALRPWIGQLVRRTCLDRLRTSSRVELTGEDPLLETADHALAEIEEAFDVHRMLAALPGHCQEVLDRFFARDESYRTIGDALDLPAGTIASRISRCLEKLRDEYEGRSQSSRPSSKKAMT